jgi:hypothetical protein
VEHFTLKQIDNKEVASLIKTLKKRTFIDCVNGKVLNDASECFEFLSALTYLFNCSFKTGEVPDLWKISTIIPINKIKNPTQDEDFRPINMLPVYEKIMKQLVKNQIDPNIKNNKIIVEEQSGFRENHSCETAVNFVLADWKENLENEKTTIAVFLDFRRAFETIDRTILLYKLEKYGFKGNAYKWFENYLKNRRQNTKVGNKISTTKNNDIGVPQGSKLGPLLFIIYINDIVNVVKNCKIKLFADDSLLYVECDDVNQGLRLINEDLERIYDYLCFNKLALNVKKIKGMIITKKNLENMLNVIHVKNEAIEIVEEIKYLGIIIDNKLNFKSHLEYVMTKMNKKYHMIRRIEG